MNRGSRYFWFSMAAAMAWAAQSLAGGLVGPPPNQVLREFGEFSVGAEYTVASRQLDCDSAGLRGGEVLGHDLMAKVAITLLDRVDLELFGGGAYKDFSASATDWGQEFEDSGAGPLGGLGVNVNFWEDRISGVEVGCAARVCFADAPTDASRWNEWFFAATLARPLGPEEAFTPYVGVKFSQIDIVMTDDAGRDLSFDESRRLGGLVGLGYAFSQRYEVLGEVHFVDETALSLGFRMSF